MYLVRKGLNMFLKKGKKRALAELRELLLIPGMVVKTRGQLVLVDF